MSTASATDATTRKQKHPGASWKQQRPTGAFDAIVIGSGIGGLTAAALLARYGNRRVLVLERHYRAGGYTHSFARKGWDWDVGVHYIGQVGERGALRGMFDRLSDGRIEWSPLPEVYDRVILGDRSYDLVAGRARFIERMCAYFPGESDAIVRYVDLVRTTARQGTMHFLGKVLPRPVGFAANAIFARSFAGLAARTTRDVLSELTKNEELIAVMTGQYGDYGLPPSQSSFAMHAALVSHYLGGGWYPTGGAERIAQGIAPLIEEKGGHIAVSAEVKEIVVEGGRAVGVRMVDDTVLRAPIVVSDAGVANTFNRLLPSEHVPPRWAQALQRVPLSFSWYALYLGYTQSDAELGLDGTNLWIYPDERHDENVRAYVADESAPFPVVYASFPSAKDPDFARRHPGHATVDLITMARWESTERWADTRWHHRGDDYEAHKQQITERLLAALHKQRPQLAGKAAHVELSTPVTAAHFAGYGRGELYGLDHTPARFALPLRPKTPVPGLFLAGADVATAGVAGGLLGGVMAAGAILGPRAVRDFVAPRRR